MRKRFVVFSLIVVAIACGSPGSSVELPDGTGPQLSPADFGTLTIRPDTGALVVGRRLRVVISATDASGIPVDASNTEVTSLNPAIAQLIGTIATPLPSPPANLAVVVATFDLTSAGSTAIRARLGILSDSLFITVVPP